MNDYVLPKIDKYTIILVNLPSPYYSSEFDYQRSVPPLGLGYIATYLKKKDINVGLLDAEVYRLSVAEISQTIQQLKPDYVGINCYSTGVKLCRELCNQINPICKKIFLGGPHISAKPSEFLDIENTVSIVGYGEVPLYELLSGKKEIPNNRILRNHQLVEDIVDVDVDQDFFVNKIIMNKGLREGVLINSRGCPYTCKYCMSAETKYKLRPIESTICEIKKLIDTHNAEMIHFLDDIVFPSNKFLKRFITQSKETGIYSKLKWRGLMSIGVLKRIDAKLLEESQCTGISIGVESGSDKIIKLIGKKYTDKDVIDIFRKFDETQIKLKLFFMIGLPTESIDDINKTRQIIKLAKKYRCVREINIFQFKPYPSTSLYNTYFKDIDVKYTYEDLRDEFKDMIVSKEMEKAIAKDTYFCEHKLLSFSLKELQKLMIEMYSDFYN